MADNLEIFGETYPNATGIKAKDTNGVTQTFVKPSGTISISTNGTGIDVSSYASANVSVPTGTARTSNDLTVSGATVTAPAGLYASAASKSVATMTLPTSTSASATSGYTSKATVSRSTSDQYINIPTGYNSAGAYYKVNAVANGSATAPASISGTSATVSTGTNTLTLTKTVSVTPSVTAGYVSTGTAGNSSVSLTASVTTQGAQTIHPSTSDQSIAASRYLTGAQTIKGVTTTNLTAANIKSGVVVKVGDSTDDDCVTSVTGTYSGGVTPTGTKSITITQNGTTTEDVTNYASAEITVNVGGGTTEAEEKDVNFIDYDGTIVYSYTAVEAQALSALPSNPTHSGLTSQGWNWTLTQIKSQLTNIGGKVWVGQMYTTQSGATEIDIELYGELRLTPYLALGINGSVDIDWGDGSAHSTATGSSLTTAVKTPHTYSTNGKYTIKITANSGTYTFFAATTYRFFGDNQNGSGKDELYISSVKAIRIGSSVPSLGEYAFYNARAIEYVTIPNTVTAYGRNAFGGFYHTKAITIPSGVSSIVQYLFTGNYNIKYISIPYSVTETGQYAFNANYSLQSITLPSGITTLGASTFLSCTRLATSLCLPSITSLNQSLFNGCSSIEKIVVPSSVSEINASVFANCYGLKELHIEASSPPTLSATNALSTTATDLVIYVPYSADHNILNSYKTASNWSSFSSKMQEESA